MTEEIKIASSLGAKLGKLYDDNFKHGSYQMPPDYLLPFIQAPKLNYNWRDTRPRLEVLLANISSDSLEPIIEIGANSGYQSLHLAKAFPKKKVIAVEGNPNHAKFIRHCADVEKLENLEVIAEYATPGELSSIAPLAIFLDFNVVHHLGVDFKEKSITSVDDWWEYGIPQWLGSISQFSEYWFSAGFMWGGDKNFPLHDLEDPAGFYFKILNSIPKAIGPDTIFWTFDKNHEDNPIPIKATQTEFDQINRSTSTAITNQAYVGEYFRRPLLKVSISD